MKISPFQALTVLAKKYRHAVANTPEAVKFSQIQNLFLMGVQRDEDRDQLVELLKDEALENYEVALGDKEVINNDPVRRYYESTLAHETLKATIDSLDMGTLNNHFNTVYDEMPLSMRFLVPFTIYRGSMNGRATKASTTAPEYIAAIKKLQDPKNFLFFKPTSEEMDGSSDEEREQKLQERINKMMVLLKTAHAAMTAVNTGGNENFPLNLYGAKDSPYSPERRGRKDRKDESSLPQVVKSTNLGIMRSYQPLGQDDPLYEDPNSPTSGLYKRPVDSATYVPGAQMPEKFFGTEVSPFVNSISGTMLCQLRVMAKLLQKEKLELNGNPEQLKAFFKSMVSYMIYNSGGHSLQEFMSVLDLPEVKDMFREVPGFDQTNLRTLFQDENELAFRSSMDSVVNYNDRILAKRELHEELVEPELDRGLEAGDDELTVRARSRLKSVKDRLDEVTSLDRKNKAIDKAYIAYTTPRDERNENQEQYEQRIKEAADILVKNLNIKSGHTNNDKEKNQQIMIKMAERQEEYRQSLFTRGKGTLAERLDKAWECYKNETRTIEDRIIAQSYLIFVLDIKDDHITEDLNVKLQTLMLERELIREKNPEYIPGKSPIALDEESKGKLKKTKVPGVSEDQVITEALKEKTLLDVNAISRKKDSGEATGKKTEFFDEKQRDMFRVLIRQGKFVTPEGELFDTSDSISKNKKGFAAFTLNVNGELSVFQHRFQEVDGVAHSSMNTAMPVFCAGEVRIENGKLLTITDRSGHYAPSLYNIYKALDYFKKQGIDISETKVYSSVKPSTTLYIDFHKSKDYPQFYEVNAKDLCNSYSAHLSKVVENIQSDLNNYQSPSFIKFLYKVKDYFIGSTLTKDRTVIAKKLSEDLISLVEEINSANSLESVKEVNEKVSKLIATAYEENVALNHQHGKKDSQGHFAKHLTFFGEKLKKSSDRVETAIKAKESEPELSEEDILSSGEQLKGVGR